MKDILAGLFFFPLDRVRDVLEFYREYVEKAPEELGVFPAFQIAPPLPFIPEKEHGKPFCIFVSCWAGDIEQGRGGAGADLQKVGPLVAEMVAPMPYPALNADVRPAAARPDSSTTGRPTSRRAHRRRDQGAHGARTARCPS